MMFLQLISSVTFSLILAQVGPAADPSRVPTEGTSKPSHYACVNNTRNGYVNLRSSPSTDSKLITKLASGTPIFYLSEKRATDGFVWYQVQANNRIGWVRSDYACNAKK